jgi:multidrug efflux system membrane fusion protein
MIRIVTRQQVIAVLVLALSLAVAGCGGKPQPRPQAPIPVTVAKAVLKTVPVQFRAIGHVEAISTVAVRARIGGELTSVGFLEGQDVRAGETLFVIDPRTYEAALRQAEAQLARDQALLRKADGDVERYAELVKKDYVTREQYDGMVAGAESLRATVAADRASVDDARLQVGYCTIKAPVAGRAGSLMVKAGNLIKANGDDPMVTLNQTRPICVGFSVPAQLLPEVNRRKGERLEVTATPPQGSAGPQEGTLTFVDNAVDTATSTVLLKATFPNVDETLWPGAFVDVLVTLGEEPDRVVVPSTAVQAGQQGTYVYVVKGDGTAEMRPVEVARMDEVEAVIAEGLAAGETVVTDGQLRLVPGSPVIVGAAPGAGVSPS